MADTKITPSPPAPVYAPEATPIGADKRKRDRERSKRDRERKRQRRERPPRRGTTDEVDEDESREEGMPHVDILVGPFQNERRRFKAVELSAGRVRAPRLGWPQKPAQRFDVAVDDLLALAQHLLVMRSDMRSSVRSSTKSGGPGMISRQGKE